MTRDEKIRRIEYLEDAGDLMTKDELVELNTLREEVGILSTSIEPEGAAIQSQIDTLFVEPAPTPKPTRKRTPKEAIEQKRREKTAIFPLTVLLDTDKGTYQYLNSQAELDENAGAVLREPERFVIIQGERKSPAVNWK